MSVLKKQLHGSNPGTFRKYQGRNQDFAKGRGDLKMEKNCASLI